MSRRRYHSTKPKRVDRQKVQEGIAGARVVLAVDVAKEKSVATLQDDEQQALVTFKWVHPRECQGDRAHERSGAEPQPWGGDGAEQHRCADVAWEPLNV